MDNNGIAAIEHPVSPAAGERVAILWLAGDGATDGATIERATVLEVDDYTMQVRIGWSGNRPLVMLFRRQVRELVQMSDEFYPAAGLPLVRESAGIPLNYRD